MSCGSALVVALGPPVGAVVGLLEVARLEDGRLGSGRHCEPGHRLRHVVGDDRLELAGEVGSLVQDDGFANQVGFGTRGRDGVRGRA
ncbi:hypothetical protein ACFQMM_00030 [Saliphagus sp. GCM10025308]